MLTAPLPTLDDATVPDPRALQEWLVRFLLDRTGDSIPPDYGDRVTFLVHQLHYSGPADRAAFAEAALALMSPPERSGDDRPLVADLLRLLAETAADCPAVHDRLGSILIQILNTPAKAIHEPPRPEALEVLSRCRLPGPNWVPIVRPYLADAETASVAYLAMVRQHPTIAPNLLPGVLATLEHAGVPTDLLLFVIGERNAERQ